MSSADEIFSTPHHYNSSRAVQSLGGILSNSKRLLVLSDGHYWSRLWCVFEIAAFSKRADNCRIDIVPMHSSLLLVGYAASLMMTNFFLCIPPSFSMPVPPFMTFWTDTFGKKNGKGYAKYLIW